MSDTISVDVTPGYQFPTDGSVAVTLELLNRLGVPTVNLTGALGTLSLADASVTTAKLAANALAASATGRGKMQDGFFADGDSSRAKFAAGFFEAGNATSLAQFDDGFLTGPKLAATAGGIIGGSRNLIVQRVSATAVDIDADELLIKTSGNIPYLALSVNLTVAITTSGANGLDTGVEASNTWYYIWVIFNPTTVTVAGLLSASSTIGTITLPAGYTYGALVGAVRNNASSDFVVFYQNDRQVWLNDSALFAGKTAAAADTYESYQAGGGGSDVDLRTVIPPIAKRLRGTAGNNSNSGLNQAIVLAANSSGLGAVTINGPARSARYNGFAFSGGFEIPIVTAQTFYWKSDDNTGPRNSVNVSGYTI